MEQMASRPFSTIPLLIEHQADLLNTKKEPPDLRGSSRRKKVPELMILIIVFDAWQRQLSVICAGNLVLLSESESPIS